MKDKEIEFKFIKEKDILQINYEKKEKTIEITKETNENLDELYDFIIENIEKVKIKEYDKENWWNQGVTGKAIVEIIECIEKEIKKIKEDKKDFALNEKQYNKKIF